MASWWDRNVVPRLISCGCTVEELMELRRKIVPRAHGDVLEIGAGGGANFALYDRSRVTSLTGIDPSDELLAIARKRSEGDPLHFDLHKGMAEELPYADNRFDTVLITFTLCSVTDPARVLAEARRVLKPGGSLLFLEHGLSPDAGPRKWQSRIEPIWKKLTGNCHLTRPPIANVRASGLMLGETHGAYQPRYPRPLAWMEWGEATKA